MPEVQAWSTLQLFPHVWFEASGMGSNMVMFVYHKAPSYDKAPLLWWGKYRMVSLFQFLSLIFPATYYHQSFSSDLYLASLCSESVEVQLSVSFQKLAYPRHFVRQDPQVQRGKAPLWFVVFDSLRDLSMSDPCLVSLTCCHFACNELGRSTAETRSNTFKYGILQLMAEILHRHLLVRVCNMCHIEGSPCDPLTWKMVQNFSHSK